MGVGNEKRIAIINSVANKSTGKIACGLLKYFQEQGVSTIFCYGHGKVIRKSGFYRIDTEPEHYYHALMCRLTGFQGGFSYLATKRLIKLLKKRKVNVIYGIGLHGYYLNEKLFWDYITEEDISFVYVMTEEYPFLGKCGYSNGCDHYLNGCGSCPQLREYPRSWFWDKTEKIFHMKQYAYSKLNHAIFVGPEYTINAGKKSPLLKGIKTAVIDEAVDTDFYYPRKISRLKDKLGIDEEKVVLVCIAPSEYERKGTKYFVELAKRFEHDRRFIFVQVGYTARKKELPRNFLPIGYITDQDLLATYYSLGDLFIFPSLLDTMPNACLEALSCGTPLLCFNVSGMPYLGNSEVMTLVEAKNVNQLFEIVNRTKRKDANIIKTCREYAVKRYSNKDYFRKLDMVLNEIGNKEA